jgi:hypothetical protein
MTARAAQIIMLLLFAGNFVLSSEQEDKIEKLNETLETLGFEPLSSDVVQNALTDNNYNIDGTLLYLIEVASQEHQDKAEALSTFDDDVFEDAGSYKSEEMLDPETEKILSSGFQEKQNQSQDVFMEFWNQNLFDEFAPKLKKVGWYERDVRSLIEFVNSNPNQLADKADFGTIVNEIVKFRLSSAYLTAYRKGRQPQCDPNLTTEVLEAGFNKILDLGFGNQFANHEILFALMDNTGDVQKAIYRLERGISDNKGASEDQKRKMIENVSKLPADIQDKISFFSESMLMNPDHFASKSKASTASSSFNIGEVGKEKENTERLLTTQNNAYGNEIQTFHDSNILNPQRTTTNCNNAFDQKLDKKQLWGRKLIEQFGQDLQKVGMDSREIEFLVSKLKPSEYVDYEDLRGEFSKMVGVITSTFSIVGQELCSMGLGDAFTSQQIYQALKTQNLNVEQAVNYLLSLYF